MKNRVSLIGAVAAFGATLAGGGVRHATALQQTVPPVKVSQATRPTLRIEFEKGQGKRVGQENVLTCQGKVKVESDGPMALSFGPDEMTLSDPASGPTKTTLHVAMDRATLQVTVTPSGTVFMDLRGNKLTVETLGAPLLSPPTGLRYKVGVKTDPIMAAVPQTHP